jgi:3-hydroxyisobutyrate dehydrogenase
MTKTGFIGLGFMGGPMARNLLNADVELMVFDIKPEAMTECVANGAKAAESVSDMAGCDTVFIIVNTGQQVEEVIFGETGLVKGVAGSHDLTVVVMSTISPNLIRDLNTRTSGKNITLIDAPVSGGPIIAELGQLSFMLGGDPDKIDTLTPFLEIMGKDIFKIGALGTGLAVKLINNIVALNNAYVFTEALSIGVESGLDVEKIVEVMGASSGKNWCTDNWDMFKQFMSMVLSEPSFHLTAEKDIETAIEWAREMKIDTPALPQVLSIVKSSQGVSETLRQELAATTG